MKGVLFCAGLLAVFGCGCLTPDRAEKDADKTAEELTIAAWEKAMGVTNIFGIASGGDPIAPLVPDTNGIVRLSLDDALRVGAKNNRRFRTLKETVFVRALALDSEEYAFSTTFSGMILGCIIQKNRQDFEINLHRSDERLKHLQRIQEAMEQEEQIS
jgi:hypothetical protein